MNELINQSLFILSGILVTLKLLFGGLIIGIFLSVPLSIMCYKKFLITVYNIFISIIRGTPLLLQLSFFCLFMPNIFNVRIDPIISCTISIGINSSAYLAEIFRSGIENIPKGQFEAAKSLHIPNFYMWKDIIFPQVIRNILPALIGEMTSLLKETAIVSTFGILDIMRLSQIISAEKFIYFMPLCIAGFYYYIIGGIIMFIGKKIEKKYDYR